MIKSDYIQNYTAPRLVLFDSVSKFKIFHFFCIFILNGIIHAQSPSWVWAKDAHTTAAEWAADVAVDTATGNVVAVGVFNSDLSAFYGGAFSAAIGGGFVAKYDASGNVLWAFKIGNNQDDACTGVAFSPIGNIYVTGYFQNIADFKGNSITSTILSSNGGKDMFIAKYNPAGQLQWVRQGGGISDDEGLAVCTNTNNIFVTGYFTNSGTFSGIPTASNRANENIFVDCYDTNGNIQWLTDAGSGQSCFGRDITADNNAVYITGDFKNTTLSVYDYNGIFSGVLTNLSPSTGDIFVMSLSVAGPFNWIKAVKSNNEDLGNGIAQNSSGIYITGAISSSANFPSYLSNPVAVGAAGLDIFVAQLSKLTGNTNWVKSEPGNNDQIAFSVCVDTSNLICVSGTFNTGINFGGGPSITSTGNEDVFIAAYSQTGTIQWVTQAGANGSDVSYAIASHSNGEIYTAGSYENNAAFGTNTLTANSPPNIFVAKIGCAPISNNSISAAQTICANQIPATLLGSTPSGGSSLYTYLWEQSPNNLTWSSATGTNNTQNYSPPALTANTYYRRTVISTGSCSGFSISSSILITVNQLPTVANAGIDSSICSSSINLYANTPVTGTGSWLQISGTGTITSVTSPTTSVSGLSGTTIFVWSISNGACAASKDTVTIKIYTLPSTSNAGPNQNLCASTTTALSANTPTVGTGAWSLVSGGGIITATANPNSSVTGLPVGSNVFMWTISNGTCPSSTSTISINVSAAPSTSNAGPNQNLCASTTTALSANTPTVGTGAWSLVSGGGIITATANPNSSVTSLPVGSNVFMWTISNGTCPSSTSTISINVSAAPSTSNAGPNQNLCASTTTALSANTPTVGTSAWSLVSGGGIITATANPNSSVTSLPVGSNIFMWTISNGTCPSSTSTISINVSAAPSTSNAGPNQNLCASTTTALSANTPTVGTGAWSLVSGGGIITATANPNSSVTSLPVGSNIFMWTISNGTCPTSTSTVAINVDAIPAIANAGSPQTICSTSSTFSANIPTVGTGAWSIVSGTGTITPINSEGANILGLTTGANIFMWTITNGTCPASTSTVVINVDAMPSTSNAGTNQIICSSTANLSANNPTVGTGVWSVFTGTATITSINSSNSSATNLSMGQNIFIWTISNGTCPASSDTVTVFANAPPTLANAGIDQELCSASTATLSANTILVGSGVWSVITGSALISNANLFNSAVSNLQIGLNTFVWTTSNNSCLSSSDTVNILVYSNPTIANAGSDMTQYSISANMNGNTPVTGTGSWSVISGGGTFANSANPTTQVTNLQFGQNIIRWTISNGVCPASFDDVIITINELSIPNGFSPNSDGANDNFEIPGITQFINVKLEVFNRWGNLVYESTDYKNDWSGKNATGEELTDDTYYFTLQIPNQKTYKGFVVLKRK